MKHFLRHTPSSFPSWLYGPVQGKLLKVEIEDCPNFGDKAYVEFDSARTAIIVVDMQVDFCGKNGYVDVMGYDLSLTAGPIKPIKNILDAVRDGTDIKVIHTREGHMPSLADLPYNKLLRSKIIGKGVGIGDKPEGGEGQLLVRGQKNWDIIDDLTPADGEYVIDKSAKGAFAHSDFGVTLKKIGNNSLDNDWYYYGCLCAYDNEGGKRYWILVHTSQRLYRCHEPRELRGRNQANQDAGRGFWLGY